MFVQYRKSIRKEIEELLKNKDCVFISPIINKQFVVNEDFEKMTFLRPKLFQIIYNICKEYNWRY